ncbi:MAG TPA: hypothetical protein VNR87_11095 [Flavisolibacter sp.]|nr:hypothetical protein [Flavisolibacter sp.]
MKQKFMAALLVACTLFVFAPAKSSAKPVLPEKVYQAANPFQIPVLVNGLPSTLTITNFAVQNGQLVATGVLSGLTNLITVPVSPTASSCQVLTLHVGAIHLDLLGLVVDLAAIDLNIRADAAPGNLLGNLLCAITNLLNNPSSQLTGVAGLLNRVLAIFG